MGKFDDFYDSGKIIAEILRKDSIGPVEEDEILSEIPTKYYIMGKLYPVDSSIEDNTQGQISELEGMDVEYEGSISLSNQREPSTMGITCALEDNTKGVKIHCEFAIYRGKKREEIESDLSKFDSKIEKFWVREANAYDLTLMFDEHRSWSFKLKDGIVLRVYSHGLFSNNSRILTFALVNTNMTTKNWYDDAELTVFQPKIRIIGLNGEQCFVPVEQKINMKIDEELKILDLLYDDSKNFAHGHGCSVKWECNEKRPYSIETEFMPEYELLQMMPNKMDNSDVLLMHHLAFAPKEKVIEGLKAFANLYKEWIEQQFLTLSLKNKDKQELGNINLEKCKQSYNRILASILSLESNDLAMRAFKFSNEAMLLQRQHTISANEPNSVPVDKCKWYPFQLAFILQELNSFINPQNIDERNLVDLLWFPTGGGKTEAYLGISAFVIFLRRMRNSSDDGVTVFMRYTLRLLTKQQFDRATLLIMACEHLRRKYKIGGNEISIGLWVGQSLTDNKLSDTKKFLNKQKNAWPRLVEKDVCLIRRCPWCGAVLTPNNYNVQDNEFEHRLFIHCANDNCEFHDEGGLPIHFIDEAIYYHQPTFIVATVDKFAQVPLQDKPAALFGLVPKKNPPELIIQDELHLISGPLGTMTGLYEYAIQKLCEKDVIKPKVIASTATIRNANKQINALYGREYSQFPPQGLSAKDSFFAIESTKDDKPARKYIGVMGVGVTNTYTNIRINAALLFASRYLEACGMQEATVDNYWTITEYFNSLRELGGTCTQIIDDVQSRFGFLVSNKFAKIYPGVRFKKYDHAEELTSRLTNSQIGDILDKLNCSYKKSSPNPDVIDFVLATNMISVGVDVARLGLMVVDGQPKSNAEYIQASSRVGRTNPGIVVAIYNGTHSRDISHYEQFIKYHSAMYRYVEATTLTPFSDRARERGLHAVFVALYRHLVPGMRAPNAASKFRRGQESDSIKNMILDYVKTVDPIEYSNVDRQLDRIITDWEDQAKAFPDLEYKSYTKYQKNKNVLLKSDTEINDPFRTMSSLRNVDIQSGLFLMER